MTTAPAPWTFAPAFAACSVWVIAGNEGTLNELWRIDPGTNAVTSRLPLGGEAFVATSAFGSVWVGHVDGRGVARVDPATNTVAARIATGSTPMIALAADETAVWALPAEEARIYRIDPATNTATSYPLPAAPGGYFGSGTLAIGGGSVWARTGDVRIARLDPRTGRVLGTIYVGAYVGEVAFGFGSIWAAVPDVNQVWRITPR